MFDHFLINDVGYMLVISLAFLTYVLYVAYKESMSKIIRFIIIKKNDTNAKYHPTVDFFFHCLDNKAPKTSQLLTIF